MWSSSKLGELGNARLLLLMLLLLALPLACVGTLLAEEAKAPPAIFVFGDSLSDVGNNNYLPYGFKYNFPHNGVDFPGGVPTGRFSNGYNIIDVIAQHMGFRQSPPAHLSLAEGQDASKGINFASGGSGHLVEWCNIKILNKNYKVCLNMSEQVEFFRHVAGGLPGELISESVFLFTCGSNDIIFFYLTHLLGPDGIVDHYIDNAISIYRSHLKELYRLGARKFAVINVPALGFTPVPIAFSVIESETQDKLNSYSRKYNEALRSMIEGLSSSMEGMKYSIGDSYAALMDVVDRPQAYGLKNISGVCCGGFRAGIERWPPLYFSFCVPAAPYCSNRSEYLFWDVIHPTQAACEHIGKLLYGGAPPFVAPISFRQLVEGDAAAKPVNVGVM